MGTSTRYSSGDEPARQMTTPDPGSGPGQATDEAIIIALARAEASLRVVLAAIAELKAEMNQHTQPTDVTPSSDTSWAGTP
jgi:hypothetical protein